LSTQIASREPTSCFSLADTDSQEKERKGEERKEKKRKEKKKEVCVQRGSAEHYGY